MYSSAEVAALMGAFSRRSPTGIRNKAMVATMYHAGLRVQETLDLAPADIDHQAQEIRVRHGKGDRARNVPIDTEGLAIIAAWEERRKSLGFNGHKRLFCTLKGGPIKSTSYVRDMLKRIQKRIGMEKRVHPHGLRHTYGLELAREGVPMNEIQALLGHANLADTSRYLKHPLSAATRMNVKPCAWPFGTSIDALTGGSPKHRTCTAGCRTCVYWPGQSTQGYGGRTISCCPRLSWSS